MNDLEGRLRCWAPRRPSPKVEAALFGPAPAPKREAPAFRLHWLAPATIGLFVACLVFNQRSYSSFSVSGNSGPIVAVILSNQAAGTYFSSDLQSEQNNLPIRTFSLTNRGGASPDRLREASSRGTNQ